MKKTIKIETLERLAFCNSDELPQVINDEGRRKRWVGIGWIDEGQATGSETKVIRSDK